MSALPVISSPAEFSPMTLALRQQFQRLSQRAKAHHESPHFGSNGILALNELRKPALELMLLATIGSRPARDWGGPVMVTPPLVVRPRLPHW